MLTKEKLKEIKQLQSYVEDHDEIQLKLNWGMLERGKEDSFYFTHEENGCIIGFIGIYIFGNTVELCGMVHPNYRRQGIFTNLHQKAIKFSKDKGFTKILLNAPFGCESAQGFLKNIPAVYVKTEYQMKWKRKSLEFSEDVVLRSASGESDFETQVDLDVKCFGFSKEGSIRYNLDIRSKSGFSFFMIHYKDETVGKINLYQKEKKTTIIGFAIDPKWQRKGIGRKALTNMILQESAKGNEIFLEVEADNEAALNLYKITGFETYQAQDYYDFLTNSIK